MATNRPPQYRYGWDNLFRDLPPNQLHPIEMSISKDGPEFTHCKMLAGHLGITNQELEEHGVFTGHNRNPAHEVLSLWYCKCHENATIRALEVALKSIGRHDVVNRLKKAMMGEPIRKNIISSIKYNLHVTR